MYKHVFNDSEYEINKSSILNLGGRYTIKPSMHSVTREGTPGRQTNTAWNSWLHPESPRIVISSIWCFTWASQHLVFPLSVGSLLHGHFRILNWRYQPYIRPMFQAYVREYPHKIWPYMVQYLHFRILKFPLIFTLVHGCCPQVHKIIQLQQCKPTQYARESQETASFSSKTIPCLICISYIIYIIYIYISNDIQQYKLICFSRKFMNSFGLRLLELVSQDAQATGGRIKLPATGFHRLHHENLGVFHKKRWF